MKVEFITVYTVSVLIENVPDNVDLDNLPIDLENKILDKADEALVNGIKPIIVDYYIEEK